MSNTTTFKEPTKIPKWIRKKLESIVRKYGRKRWFPKVWASYIKLCKTTAVRDLPDPDAFFEQERLKNGVEEEPKSVVDNPVPVTTVEKKQNYNEGAKYEKHYNQDSRKNKNYPQKDSKQSV